jgi:hypothetical protein
VRRIIPAAIAAVSLLTPAVMFSGPATAATRVATTINAVAQAPMRLKLVRAPASSLSPAMPGRLTGSRATSESTDGDAFEIVSAYFPYCLNANNAGSSKGQNGDKVQLWTCTGSSNEMWNITKAQGGGWYELYNQEFSSECLNADDTGGLGNGSLVQLWSCSAGGGNEYWDVTHWSECTVDGAACELALYAGDDLTLNANSGDVGNGDYVQVWSGSATGDAPLWAPYPEETIGP